MNPSGESEDASGGVSDLSTSAPGPGRAAGAGSAVPNRAVSSQSTDLPQRRPVERARSGRLPAPGVEAAARGRDSALEDAELARKLAVVAFVRVAVVTVSLAAFLAFGQPAATEFANWRYVLVVATYGLSIVYAVMLRYRAVVLLLAYAQIVLDTGLITLLVALTRGIESVFAFVYVFIVLGACLSLYRRGAIVAAICYFLFFGTLVLVQVDSHINLLPGVDFGPALFSFVMYSVGIALIAVLASKLAEKALATRRELAAAESDYQELAELHAAILRSLPAGLMTVEGDGTISFANEAACAILAVPPDEIIGRPLAAIVPRMARRYETAAAQAGIVGGHRERFEESHRRGDGRNIRLGFSFAPLGGAARVSEGEQAKGSIAVFQDVTEIVRLKEAYERAERLATVGKVAAGLAHEVRNPLASMCASIEVIKAAVEPPEPLRRLMTNVVNEADRLNALISEFLEFARPREPRRTLVDVSRIAADVIELFRNDQLLAGIEVDIQLAPNVQGLVDRDQVRQVLWNLVKNAAEAMGQQGADGSGGSGGGGRLVVSTRQNQDDIEIMIRDSGPGIPAELMKRIFDPFFTTKNRGSGLGLAISHSIVQAHDGRILLESKAGEGTEVTIVLPACTRGPGKLRPEETSGGLEVPELIGPAAGLEPASNMSQEEW